MTSFVPVNDTQVCMYDQRADGAVTRGEFRNTVPNWKRHLAEAKPSGPPLPPDESWCPFLEKYIVRPPWWRKPFTIEAARVYENCVLPIVPTGAADSTSTTASAPITSVATPVSAGASTSTSAVVSSTTVTAATTASAAPIVVTSVITSASDVMTAPNVVSTSGGVTIVRTSAPAVMPTSHSVTITSVLAPAVSTGMPAGSAGMPTEPSMPSAATSLRPDSRETTESDDDIRASLNEGVDDVNLFSFSEHENDTADDESLKKLTLVETTSAATNDDDSDWETISSTSTCGPYHLRSRTALRAAEADDTEVVDSATEADDTEVVDSAAEVDDTEVVDDAAEADDDAETVDGATCLLNATIGTEDVVLQAPLLNVDVQESRPVSSLASAAADEVMRQHDAAAGAMSDLSSISTPSTVSRDERWRWLNQVDAFQAVMAVSAVVQAGDNTDTAIVIEDAETQGRASTSTSAQVVVEPAAEDIRPPEAALAVAASTPAVEVSHAVDESSGSVTSTAAELVGETVATVAVEVDRRPPVNTTGVSSVERPEMTPPVSTGMPVSPVSLSTTSTSASISDSTLSVRAPDTATTDTVIVIDDVLELGAITSPPTATSAIRSTSAPAAGIQHDVIEIVDDAPAVAEAAPAPSADRVQEDTEAFREELTDVARSDVVDLAAEAPVVAEAEEALVATTSEEHAPARTAPSDDEPAANEQCEAAVGEVTAVTADTRDTSPPGDDSAPSVAALITDQPSDDVPPEVSVLIYEMITAVETNLEPPTPQRRAAEADSEQVGEAQAVSAGTPAEPTGRPIEPTVDVSMPEASTAAPPAAADTVPRATDDAGRATAAENRPSTSSDGDAAAEVVDLTANSDAEAAVETRETSSTRDDVVVPVASTSTAAPPDVIADEALAAPDVDDELVAAATASTATSHYEDAVEARSVSRRATSPAPSSVAPSFVSAESSMRRTQRWVRAMDLAGRSGDVLVGRSHLQPLHLMHDEPVYYDMMPLTPRAAVVTRWLAELPQPRRRRPLRATLRFRLT